MNRISTVLLAFLVCVPAYAATFDERVTLAENAEKKVEVSNYLYKEMFPAIGSTLGGIMMNCLAKPNANQDKFTIVADVQESGRFINIQVEPKNNTATCFSNGFSALKLPPLLKCNCSPLPIVIHMATKP